MKVKIKNNDKNQIHQKVKKKKIIFNNNINDVFFSSVTPLFSILNLIQKYFIIA